MATDYDEVRSDVKESQDTSLAAFHSANTPDARSVVRELDEADTVDGVDLPGDYIAEELIVQVIPRQTTSSPAIPASWCAIAHSSPAKRTATDTARNVKAKPRAANAGASTLIPSCATNGEP